MVVLVVLSCGLFVFRIYKSDRVCRDNLRAIAAQLEYSSVQYPDTFNEIYKTGLRLDIFICPYSGKQPGSVNDIDIWTDYIYIGGLPDSGALHAIVAISPPEDHFGGYGYAVNMLGQIRRVSRAEILKILQSPWVYCENPDDVGLQSSIRRHMTVRIPERFKNSYVILPLEQNASTNRILR
jgi:hypothetical protein